MSVYLHMSFNFRHVSAAYGPSSGKSLIIGETNFLKKITVALLTEVLKI
jgi:hypothetical protein